VIHEYLLAWQLRPSRAEPLIDLAQFFWRKRDELRDFIESLCHLVWILKAARQNHHSLLPSEAPPPWHRLNTVCKSAEHMIFPLAKLAMHMDWPSSDLLFIDKVAYNFTRFELVSITAYKFGEHALGLRASEQALLVRPDAEYLQKNRDWYIRKLESVADSSFGDDECVEEK